MSLNPYDRLFQIMKQNTRKVFLCSIVNNHGSQLALGLQKFGFLNKYLLSYYLKNTHITILKALGITNIENSAFYRRRKVHINDSLVINTILPDLLLFLSNQTNYTFFKKICLSLRKHSFYFICKILINKYKPKIVICLDGNALGIFRYCNSKGIICILDQATGHLTSAVKEVEIEKKLRPAFIKSMPITTKMQINEAIEESMMANYIFVASNYVKNTLTEIGIPLKKIRKIPYGVDTSQFRPIERTISRTKKFQVLYVGRVSQAKGIYYLLEAIHLTRIENIEVILIGQQLLPSEYLSKHKYTIKLISNVDHSQIHTFYQNADIFVFPSLHEGSAMVIYEALACGLPVITTKNAGSVITDEKEGFIVPVRNSKIIANKINILYKDTKRRREMAKNACITANRHTWEQYHSNIGQAIQAILNTI